jgi:hypothetical protein
MAGPGPGATVTKELPGGWRQRPRSVRILHEPSIVFLDE